MLRQPSACSSGALQTQWAATANGQEMEAGRRRAEGTRAALIKKERLVSQQERKVNYFYMSEIVEQQFKGVLGEVMGTCLRLCSRTGS